MIACHVHEQGWSQQHGRLQEIRSELINQFLNNKMMNHLTMIKILAMTNTDQTIEIKSIFSVATTSILLMLTGFFFYDNWVKAKYCSNSNNNSHHNNDVNPQTGEICPYERQRTVRSNLWRSKKVSYFRAQNITDSNSCESISRHNSDNIYCDRNKQYGCTKDTHPLKNGSKHYSKNGSAKLMTDEYLIIMAATTLTIGDKYLHKCNCVYHSDNIGNGKYFHCGSEKYTHDNSNGLSFHVDGKTSLMLKMTMFFTDNNSCDYFNEKGGSLCFDSGDLVDSGANYLNTGGDCGDFLHVGGKYSYNDRDHFNDDCCMKVEHHFSHLSWSSANTNEGAIYMTAGYDEYAGFYNKSPNTKLITFQSDR